MPYPPLHPPPDEGFLNKSLLDQLDAQADAEPVSSGASDDSELGSPHVPYQEYTSTQQHDNISNNTANTNTNFKMSSPFYPRASFTAFPNATRPQARAYREPPSATAQQFYPADPFPPQLTSPVLQPYDPRASFDFKSSAGGPYALDAAYAQQQQQQPQKLNGYAAPYVNGGGMHSQTPYGPHVPMGVVNGAGLPPPSMMGPMGAMQEDISTIFVVGFPEDMQEREFQNMFTFSPGFEAATLKIPNKEYTAYGGVLLPTPNNANGGANTNNGGAGANNATNATGGRALGGAGTYNAYAGSNDPYNLVTVNQGGVVVDGGRDGGMASWPAAPAQGNSNSDELTPHYNNNNNNPNANMGMGMGAGNGGGGGGGVAPRKQIIGFAKFRTRQCCPS